MTLSGALREIATLVDQFDDRGREVVDVSIGDAATDGELTARLTVAVPVLDGVTTDGVDVAPDTAAVAADGTVQVALEATVPANGAAPTPTTAGESNGEHEAETVTGGTDADGPAKADDAADARESIDADGTGPEDGAASERAAADADAEATAEEPDDEATPAYKDPDRLRAAYEEYDSFPKMKEALGVDVSAQTVRRHMIKHGIHTIEDPSGDAGEDEANETGADAEATGEGGDAADEDREPSADPDAGDQEPEAETTLADGIDLPAGVGLSDVKSIVAGARTMHEVQRELGVDRERARRLLRELDLLDFVTGRVSTTDERRPTAEEIDARIKGASPGGA